jgi:hypothetical protein
MKKVDRYTIKGIVRIERIELRQTSFTPGVQSTSFNWQNTTTLNPTGADAASKTASLIK